MISLVPACTAMTGTPCPAMPYLNQNSSNSSKEQTKNITNRGLGLNLKLNPAGRCTGSF